MELTAVIRALERLKHAARSAHPPRRKVRVLTDSQWLAFCASGKWKRKANLDLWERYERAAAGMEIEWEWQPRNVTEPMREVDRLAKAAAARAC